MQLSFSALFISALIPLALAGGNCKCQDSTGQYDSYTEQVCNAMKSQEASSTSGIPVVGSLISMFTADATYHGDQHHQCSSAGGSLNSGEFVQACAALGVGTSPYGGAYCWN